MWLRLESPRRRPDPRGRSDPGSRCAGARAAAARARVAAIVAALVARRAGSRSGSGCTRPSRRPGFQERLPRLLRRPDAVRPAPARGDAQRHPRRGLRVHARARAGDRGAPAARGRARPARRRRLAGDARRAGARPRRGDRDPARRCSSCSPASRRGACRASPSRPRSSLQSPRSSLTSSSAVAKGELVGWQHWDFYNAPAAPVSVSLRLGRAVRRPALSAQANDGARDQGAAHRALLARDRARPLRRRPLGRGRPLTTRDFLEPAASRDRKTWIRAGHHGEGALRHAPRRCGDPGRVRHP